MNGKSTDIMHGGIKKWNKFVAKVMADIGIETFFFRVEIPVRRNLCCDVYISRRGFPGALHLESW